MSRRRNNQLASEQNGRKRQNLSRLSPANRLRLSASSLRLFVAIANLWRLSETDRRLVLGYPSRATYYRWRAQVEKRRNITLSVDVLWRISNLLTIQQGLEALFPTERQGVDWLRAPNNAPVFHGRTPLELIASGFSDDQVRVRSFVIGALGSEPLQLNRIAEALGRSASCEFRLL